jgi:hypothetical protein
MAGANEFAQREASTHELNSFKDVLDRMKNWFKGNF